MSDFESAIILLSKGEKIRRSHWNKGYYITSNWKGELIGRDKIPYKIKLSSMLGNDWEIYVEPKIKCKLCNEERLIILDGMCDLCNEYLTKRVFRICQDTLREVVL